MKTNRVLSATLKQRIQLWSRVRTETEEGDLADTWLPITWAWAKIRYSQPPDREDQQKVRLEVIMRKMPYKFHGIQWKGKAYLLLSPPFEDSENQTSRYSVRNCRDF